MRISIIGTGYVGLITGACFADLGNEVICVDVVEEKVEKINKGIAPIYEKGLDEMLKRVTSSGKLKATLDYDYAIKNSDITFIAVGTPSNERGEIDLRYIKEASKRIGEVLREKEGRHLVVVKSTVLPGTTEGVVKKIIEETSGREVEVAMNPEFLREGKAIEDFMNPDRIVIGYESEWGKSILDEVYKDFDAPKLFVNIKVAEMIKYASNAFLAMKISYANEIGNICKMLGIDVYEVMKGVGMDFRISPHFLNAGVGFGGSCFPKDVSALKEFSKKLGYKPRLLEATLEINEEQPLRLVNLALKDLGKYKEAIILGLAFKPETDDVRESRSLVVMKELIKRGIKIYAYDPKAIENAKKIIPEGERVAYVNDLNEVMKKAKVVFILTDWDEFKNEELYEGKIVYDGRKVIKGTKAEKYEGICW